MYSYALITNHHHMIGNWLLKLLHFWSWNPHCFLFAEHRTTKTDFVLRRCGRSFLWPVSEPEERSKINRIQPSTIGISWDLIWFNSSNSIVNGWISRKSRGNMRKRWFLPQQSPTYYIGLQFRFFFFNLFWETINVASIPHLVIQACAAMFILGQSSYADALQIPSLL